MVHLDAHTMIIFSDRILTDIQLTTAKPWSQWSRNGQLAMVNWMFWAVVNSMNGQDPIGSGHHSTHKSGPGIRRDPSMPELKSHWSIGESSSETTLGKTVSPRPEGQRTMSSKIIVQMCFESDHQDRRLRYDVL